MQDENNNHPEENLSSNLLCWHGNDAGRDITVFCTIRKQKNYDKKYHIIKYKTSTKDMVKSLELVVAVPMVPGMKIK